MTLLISIVGLLDLRMLGLGKGLPLKPCPDTTSVPGEYTTGTEVGNSRWRFFGSRRRSGRGIRRS